MGGTVEEMELPLPFTTKDELDLQSLASGFRVQGSGFRVQGSGFRIES